MVYRFALAIAAGALAAAPLTAEEAHRELGAHEHGHSTLNIAIEGNLIAMELEAPGADIVGFEHAAESAEDQAAVEQAEAALMEPLALFVLPAAAGCAVDGAVVEIEGDEHEEHEEGHAEADHEGEAGHNEFHAEYTLTCTDTDQIDAIDFAYFDRFAGAQEVEVTVITDTGQRSFEVERDEPRVELQGLM